MVDPTSSEIEPYLDFDPVDVEAGAAVDLRAFGAFQVGKLETSNQLRSGCQDASTVDPS